MRFLSYVMALVLWASMPAAGQHSLDTLDARTLAQHYGAVGRLDLGHGGFCTGALVSENTVLTAAHCLFDSYDGTRIPVEHMSFHAGLVDGQALGSSAVARVVMHPGYSFVHGEQLDRVGSDLALVELATPLSGPGLTPFRTQDTIARGAHVEVVSYALGRADAPAVEQGCGVLTRDLEVLVLSCSVDFGASGAPIFQRFGDEIRIVSVISAKADWKDRSVALAAAMEQDLAVLEAAYRGDVAGLSTETSNSARP